MPTTMNQNQQNQDQYLDIEIGGVLIPRMKIMKAQYKGRCCRTGQWFDPNKGEFTIAFKHKDQLTDMQKKAVFGNGQVYHVTVLVDQLSEPAAEGVAPQQVATNHVVQQKKEWTPSVYQSNILDKLLHSLCHLFIEALAGCGKTETLVWLVKQMLRHGLMKGKQVVYLAFNKSIQEELVKKLIGTGCPAMTTHAFGLQMLKKNFKELEKAGASVVQNSKTSDLFLQMLAIDLFGDVSAMSLKKVKKTDHYKVRKPVLSLVGFIKNWAIIPTLNQEGGYDFSPEQFQKILGFFKEYQISTPDKFTKEQLADYACRVTCMSIPLPGDALTRVSFDDMLYLPLALGLDFPKYDLVLTDESQDFNEAQEQFLFNLAGKGARCIVVGDQHQAIYRFRGADSKAFLRIKETLAKTPQGVESCELPINYRSDEAIIEHARQWVPNLQGRGVALGQQKGEVVFETTYSQALQWANNSGEEEFAFLCRINVPLVVTAYQLIAQGKRVCIIGRQAIASPMLAIIEDLCGTPDRFGNVPEHYTDRITDRKAPSGAVVEEGLLTRLAAYYRSQAAKLSEEKHEQALEDLTNNVDCIEIIAGRVQQDSVKAVVKEIESLFVEKPDDKGTIKLSTVHRAKGLEWDTVLILCPNLMPHPNVKPNEDGSWSEDQQQEENLQYVASTRAKHKLHYICNWPFGRGKGTRIVPMVDDYVDPQHKFQPARATTVTPQAPTQPIRRIEVAEIPGRKVHVSVTEPVVKGPATPAPATFVDDGEPF